jgi:hypothetical protein
MKNTNILMLIFPLLLFIFSCTKDEEIIEIQIEIPSFFELMNTNVHGLPYRVGSNGSVVEVTHEEYFQNVGGFEGLLLPDLLDSMQNLYRPADSIFIKNENLLDLFGYNFLGFEFDASDLTYYFESNYIKINYEYFDDVFIMDIKIITESQIQISYMAYQYSKKSIDLQRSPLFFEQFKHGNSIELIAKDIIKLEELQMDDYLMVVKGEYIYDRTK